MISYTKHNLPTGCFGRMASIVNNTNQTGRRFSTISPQPQQARAMSDLGARLSSSRASTPSPISHAPNLKRKLGDTDLAEYDEDSDDLHILGEQRVSDYDSRRLERTPNGSISAPFIIPDSDDEDEVVWNGGGDGEETLGYYGAEEIEDGRDQAIMKGQHVNKDILRVPFSDSPGPKEGTPEGPPSKRQRFSPEIQDFLSPRNDRAAAAERNSSNVSVPTTPQQDNERDVIIREVNPIEDDSPVTIYISNTEIMVPLSCLTEREDYYSQARPHPEQMHEYVIDDPFFRSIRPSSAIPDVGEFLESGDYGPPIVWADGLPVSLEGVDTTEEQERELPRCMLALGIAADMELWDMAELSMLKLLALHYWNSAQVIVLTKLAFSRPLPRLEWDIDFKDFMLQEVVERYEELREMENEGMRELMTAHNEMAVEVYRMLLDRAMKKAKERQGQEEWVNEYPPESFR